MRESLGLRVIDERETIELLCQSEKKQRQEEDGRMCEERDHDAGDDAEWITEGKNEESCSENIRRKCSIISSVATAGRACNNAIKRRVSKKMMVTGKRLAHVIHLLSCPDLLSSDPLLTP